MKPNDDRSFDENEWTPEERARLGALNAERVPPPELEWRTLSALKQQGMLGGRQRLSTRFVVGALLAASAVFVAGALVGYAAANRRPAAIAPPAVASTRAVAQIESTVPATPAKHVVWY
jgi:hypothetical protein